jgi:hypothetical protein
MLSGWEVWCVRRVTGRLLKGKRWHRRYSKVHKCTKKHLQEC